jgi:hypothetical protein
MDYMAPPKPPEDLSNFTAPDFSRRQDFEQMVFDHIGGNPFMINVDDEVRRADEDLPNLYRHIFQGRIRWEDRHLMNNKERDYWNMMIKKYHADVESSVNAGKAQQIEAYNFMMNQFDNHAKEYESKLKEYQTRLKDWDEKYGETYRRKREMDIESKTDAAAIQIAKEKHMTKWGDERKASQPKEPSREDIISIARYEDSIFENLGPGDQIPPDQLRTVNRLRAAVGIPILEEHLIREGKKKKLFGIDVLWPDEKAEYGYKEKTKGGERTVVEERMYKGRKLVKYSTGEIEWEK